MVLIYLTKIAKNPREIAILRFNIAKRGNFIGKDYICEDNP